MIDFPSNPTVGQIFDTGSLSYEWNGVAWISVSSGGSGAVTFPLAIPLGGTEATTAGVALSNLGGITDAPSDGKNYVRKNGGWVEAPAGGTYVAGPSFSAYRNASVALTSGQYTEAVFDLERWDSHNCYNVATGRFTPNVPGRYQINATAMFGVVGNTITQAYAIIYKNGAAYKRGDASINAGGTADRTGQAVTVSGVIELNGTTDYVSIFVQCTGTTPNLNAGADHVSWFDGFLIGPAAALARITTLEAK